MRKTSKNKTKWGIQKIILGTLLTSFLVVTSTFHCGQGAQTGKGCNGEYNDGSRENVEKALDTYDETKGEKPDFRCTDFKDQDLNDLDFYGLNLSGSHFSRANLDKASFRKTDLSKSNGIDSNWIGAMLAGANMNNFIWNKKTIFLYEELRMAKNVPPELLESVMKKEEAEK